MIKINDIIIEITKTSKTPNGISIYKDESCCTLKSLSELFSEVDEICDELGDDKLYNLVLLLSSIREKVVKNGNN